MQFLWTTLNVGDLDKSLTFYRDVLGLELQRRFSPAEGIEIAFLGEGETKVELVCREGEPSPSHGSDLSMGFKTDSVDKTMAKFKVMGIEIVDGPFQPGPHIRFFYVHDPDGARIQIVEES